MPKLQFGRAQLSSFSDFFSAASQARKEASPEVLEPAGDMGLPTKDREILTAQAIEKIEQELGDVGRGADYPMSRCRGGSASSRGNANSIPPPPTCPPPPPPIPAEHRQLARVPVALAGDTLTVPRTRPSRSRGVSSPGSLVPIEGGKYDYFQVPVPPLPVLGSTTTTPPSPAPPSAPRLQQGEWTQEELEDWQQEIALELAKPIRSRRRSARAPSAPARSSYSLFPPVPPVPPLPAPRPLPELPSRPERRVSSTLATPSGASKSSSPANDFPFLTRPQDLVSVSPSDLPAPPPFRHNWDQPNRTAARTSVDPPRSHQTGYHAGPPAGSGTRPAPALVTVSEAPFPAATAHSEHWTAPSRNTQFNHYPMMSPYDSEAETMCDETHGVGLGLYQSKHDPQGFEREMAPQFGATISPVLDHDVLSADEAAAAIAAATQVRNTIFIDRGIDINLGPVNRSSSCYGDEKEGEETGALRNGSASGGV